MARCTDCGGNTPAPYWKRCVACAHRRLRILMSPIPIDPPKVIRRRFARGDRVIWNEKPYTVLRFDVMRREHVIVTDSEGERFAAPVVEITHHEQTPAAASKPASDPSPERHGAGRGDQGGVPGVPGETGGSHRLGAREPEESGRDRQGPQGE